MQSRKEPETINIIGHSSSLLQLIRSLDTVSKSTAIALIEMCIELNFIVEYTDNVLSAARMRCKENKLFMPASVVIK
jgi:2-phospho-L-lactate transferase/gluconeogenesis factor (CofD/UPF0052 family)